MGKQNKPKFGAFENQSLQMEEKNTEDKKKRVSFAPEPQVMYIYPEEESLNSKVTESGITSEDEISMELTADHLKFSGLELLDFEKNDKPLQDTNFLDMDLDRLVERENIGNTGRRNSLGENVFSTAVEYEEKPVLMSSGNCAISVNANKDLNGSGMEKQSRADDCTQIEMPDLEEAVESQSLEGTVLEENSLQGDEKADMPIKRGRKSVEASQKKPRGSVKDGGKNVARSSLRNESETRRKPQLRTRRSIGDGDGEFDNTVISNDTINVEEIIDTQDLRKIIPQAKKEVTNVSELLVSKGIRFLDNLVVSNTRRDTISKSKNDVHPKQIQFYENFLEPRTSFFLNFSEDLEKRMKRQEKVNMELENNFSILGTVFEGEDAVNQLRALKAECRMRAKIDWYELRKEKELEFNQMILNRKNNLTYDYNALESSLQEVEERLKQKEASNNKREEQISRIRSRIGGVDGDMSGNNVLKADSECRPQKIEELRELMNEQETVSENIKKELEQLNAEKKMKEAEKRALKESLEGVAADIKELEKTLKTRNITEAQLKEVRQEFRTLCAVFNWEILKMDSEEIRFRLLGYDFTIGLGPEFVITSSNVKVLEDGGGHPLYVHGTKYLDSVGLSFSRGMKKMVFLTSVISGIHKELVIIKNSHSVECYTKDDQVVIKVTLVNVPKCSKKDVVMIIGNGFECSIVEDGNSVIHDLTNSFGLITKIVNSAYLSL